jgi:hypothetical protein
MRTCSPRVVPTKPLRRGMCGVCLASSLLLSWPWMTSSKNITKDPQETTTAAVRSAAVHRKSIGNTSANANVHPVVASVLHSGDVARCSNGEKNPYTRQEQPSQDTITHVTGESQRTHSSELHRCARRRSTHAQDQTMAIALDIFSCAVCATSVRMEVV